MVAVATRLQAAWQLWRQRWAAHLIQFAIGSIWCFIGENLTYRKFDLFLPQFGIKGQLKFDSNFIPTLLYKTPNTPNRELGEYWMRCAAQR